MTKLNCTKDIGNSCNLMTVTIIKEIDGDIVTVGHVPIRISALCSVVFTLQCIVMFIEGIQLVYLKILSLPAEELLQFLLDNRKNKQYQLLVSQMKHYVVSKQLQLVLFLSRASTFSPRFTSGSIECAPVPKNVHNSRNYLMQN